MASGPITVKDKPIFEQVPLRNGYPTRTEEEIQRRHTVLRGVMDEDRLDAVLVFGAGFRNSDILYYSNWPGGTEGYVLMYPDRDPTVLVQLYNHVPLAEKLSMIPDVRWAGGDGATTVAACLTEAGKRRGRLGLIGGLSHAMYERLREAAPDFELVDLARQYRQIRMIRHEEERFWAHIGSEITDRAIDALEREIRPGLREYDLATIVEAAFLREGGQTGIHFMSSMAMKDPTCFNPNQYHSNRVLQKGDVITSEITGTFWGYGGQIHRTFFLGEPTPEWVKLHDVAMKAYDAIEASFKDGAPIEATMDAAELIHKEGYTQFDDAAHGSGVFYPVVRSWSTQHKSPSRTWGVADRNEGFVFREGMTMVIQPQPVTLDWRMGLQFGETVWITKDGTERLNHYPRKMVVID